MTLAEYGDRVWDLAMRGLEAKTLVPYGAGWRLRVVPSLGHLTAQAVTAGAADRAVLGWIAEQAGRSSVKNSLAALARVMQQAVRDGLIDTNPAKVVGWQQLYRQAEDEAHDPRAPAIKDWPALQDLAAALVARSHGRYEGWGEVVAAPTPRPGHGRLPHSGLRRMVPSPKGARTPTCTKYLMLPCLSEPPRHPEAASAECHAL
ncbi:hypothetical protein LO772_30420 [Yinghuangia sp. ASG 101]|uniref:hypothetical protein n=1 Tax=Yinghuangia sp. ASG 101 TaxID=2896848 RepID=UPI001E45F932|nr:hypothetical protein [Yinghuangia sp. ASG 101]UGQ11077.1 hypothetical protein LO772_30420 [Yinghuangia sp. ASG 101]